jgi:hypothetical protein
MNVGRPRFMLMAGVLELADEILRGQGFVLRQGVVPQDLISLTKQDLVNDLKKEKQGLPGHFRCKRKRSIDTHRTLVSAGERYEHLAWFQKLPRESGICT